MWVTDWECGSLVTNYPRATAVLESPSYSIESPGFLLFRLEKLRQSNDIIIASLSATDEIQSLRSKCLSILSLEATPTKAELRKQTDKHTRQQLYSTVDGKGLQEAKKFPQANQWIRGATRLMHGNSFIHSIHLRINQLPTREQVTRGGRPGEVPILVPELTIGRLP